MGQNGGEATIMISVSYVSVYLVERYLGGIECVDEF